LAVREFAAVHVVSPVDADYLMRRNPGANNVEVISLCAEPEFLGLPLEHPHCADRIKRQAVIVTSGNLREAYIAEPVVQFIKSGFTEIKSIWPDVSLIVIGAGASKKYARAMEAESNVRLIPWVDNYVDAIRKADILIFLDKSGSGMKTRVIQALAAGKPVVGTKTALEGIKVTDGIDAFLCSSVGDIVQIIRRLIEDSELRIKVGFSARELVKKYYERSIIGEKWELFYKRVVNGYKAKPVETPGNMD